MHRADDTAQHKNMNERMVRIKISGCHLQPLILCIVDEEPRIYREQHGKPA